jgi:hypothetical protein
MADADESLALLVQKYAYCWYKSTSTDAIKKQVGRRHSMRGGGGVSVC